MRLVTLITLPKVITRPGQYRTRCGEVVTVTAVSRAWATGHYADGTTEEWDVSGRLLPFSLSANDITSEVAHA